MESNSNKTKYIKTKLVEGYEFATQLKLLFSQQHILQTRFVSGSGLVDELMAKILSSFQETILVLDSFDHLAADFSGEGSCGDDSVAPASCNGGDSGESSKRLRVGKDKGKRGCYTRKKRLHTWTVEARKIDIDRYAWRKYGQKKILNTQSPRSYFRCTHKPTQGCKATKQVQKQEQDPEMFQITYIGHHTCNASNQTQANTEAFNREIIMNSDNKLASTFDQNHVNANGQGQGQEKDISSVVTVGAKIVKEEESINVDQNYKDSICEGSLANGEFSLVWQDVMMFDDHNQNQHDHQNHYYHGDTSTNTSHQFTFFDNDQFSSLFDSYCSYEGTNVV
ncbi:unnamed protein product [Cochlearia groenlandica]